MNQKLLTISSINLWGFNDWGKRLPSLISLIKQINPDLVFFQEATVDKTIDSRDQVQILNEILGYTYSVFAPAGIKTFKKGVPLPNPIEHGLGVLSRFPIITETIKLAKASDDSMPRILLKSEVSVGAQKLTMTGVHFSNSDAWSEAHLKETLDVFQPRSLSTILIGDFNIRDLLRYKNLYDHSYFSSGDDFSYISYPKDKVSYDYILIPKSLYKFEDFQCREEYVSDHRLITAKIQILK